jgi:hypothetical protein
MIKTHCIVILIGLILATGLITSPAHAQMGFEIGPSYIINLNDENWENSTGINLGINYKMFENLVVNTRFSLYRFSSKSGFIENLFSTYSSPGSIDQIFESANAKFNDISFALRFEPATGIINPLFSVRGGLHFVELKETRSQIIIFNQEPNPGLGEELTNKNIGYLAFGVGVNIVLASKAFLQIESAYSFSMDYDLRFVPIDFILKFYF